MHYLLGIPFSDRYYIDEPTFSSTDPRNTLNAWDLIYNITQLPMTTIAAIDGQAHGVGNEFLVALDMRFATNKAVLGQPEITAGFIPGAGGAQNLARLIGRGRAMEYVLSGKDISAKEADRIGWINQLFDSRAEMNTYVDQLAKRISLFSLDAITAARQTINSASSASFQQMQLEAETFEALAATNESVELQEKLLELTRNETSVPFFLNLGANVLEMYGVPPSNN